MERIFGRIIMTLCCTILLAATGQAGTLKQVYLRDGGIIECQNVWKANGKVMVLINRDTLLDLPRSEVDLKKTFAWKPAKIVKKQKKKAPSRLSAAKPVVAAVAVQRPEATRKPAAKPVPLVKKQTAQTGKPAPPTSKQPPSKGLQKAPPAATKQVPEPVKPAPQAVKQKAPATAKPAPPAAVMTPTAAKQAVQQTATSAKKQVPGAATATPKPPRAALPLAKAAAPSEERKSFLAENMTNIGLGALLVLLLAGYMVYKKKQKG